MADSFNDTLKTVKDVDFSRFNSLLSVFKISPPSLSHTSESDAMTSSGNPSLKSIVSSKVQQTAEAYSQTLSDHHLMILTRKLITGLLIFI